MVQAKLDHFSDWLIGLISDQSESGSRYEHFFAVCLGLDSTLHLINHYPADTCWQNKPRYPLDSDLSGG